MEIIKNKRKSKCGLCFKEVSGYKVKERTRNYHLRCYWNWLEKRLASMKETRKKLSRYKKHMILEALE